jgi:CHAD domain-containing protein
MTISKYITKMKSLADEMGSTKQAIGDEELVSYILARFDEEFNPVASAIVAHVESVSVGDVHSQL